MTTPPRELTPDEKAALVALMVRAKERGDDHLLDDLAATAADPAAFRAMLADDPTPAEG